MQHGPGCKPLLLSLAVAVTLAVAPASRGASPAQIYTDDSSGMVQTLSDCDSGQYVGSGFLIGPRVMITALHVLEDEHGSGNACATTVVQNGTGRRARVVKWDRYYSSSRKDFRTTDFAVALLDTSLSGYYFRLASAPPGAGTPVVALGYSLGEGLSLNQGHVVEATRSGGVPELVLDLLSAGGASGGPILDRNGHVVGLAQRAIVSTYASSIFSLDLATFIGGTPRTLCGGVVVGQQATVCADGPRQTSIPVSTWNAPAYVVDSYWSLLQQHEYTTAYTYFSAAEQQRVRGLATWLEYFHNDPVVSVTVSVSTEAINGDTATVRVRRLRTVGRQTGCRDWSGTYKLVRGYDGWLVDYAALTFKAC
jgi:hypothetical protein